MTDTLRTIALLAGVIISIGGAAEVTRRMIINTWRAYRATKSAITHLAEVRDVVVRELMPNGGGSLVDRVHRIDIRLARIEQENQDG